MAPDLHTLTGAYAADALADDDERRDFESHLAACADCREEVRTLRETVALLAVAASRTPPPGLRDRVLAEVAATAQVRRTAGPAGAAAARPGAPRWLVAAAAAAVVAGLAVGGTGLEQARQAHRDQVVAEQRADRVARILADPQGRRVTGPVTGGGAVTVVSAPAGTVLVTAGVAGLPGGRTYQLWVLRAATVTSAGLGPGGGSAAGSWVRLVDGVRPGDKVAVSVEPAGGSDQPTTTPVSVLQV